MEVSCRLRPATNLDSEAVIQLIDRVYREYGDCVHLADADRDLLDLEQNYAGQGGSFVVLEGAGEIVGCHATLPLESAVGRGTFRRLYLEASLRGGPWGQVLMDWAIDWARQSGWRRIEFWSDTRFQRAHRFFTQFGFERDGRLREMQDGHQPYKEYGFSMELPS